MVQYTHTYYVGDIISRSLSATFLLLAMVTVSVCIWFSVDQ